jgi:hypothetical protein
LKTGLGSTSSKFGAAVAGTAHFLGLSCPLREAGYHVVPQVINIPLLMQAYTVN